MYNEDALGAEEPPYLRVCRRPTCRVGGGAGEPADPGEAEVGETEEGGGAGQQGGGVPAAVPGEPRPLPAPAQPGGRVSLRLAPAQQSATLLQVLVSSCLIVRFAPCSTSTRSVVTFTRGRQASSSGASCTQHRMVTENNGESSCDLVPGVAGKSGRFSTNPGPGTANN